jgi:hypothetical protein
MYSLLFREINQFVPFVAQNNSWSEIYVKKRAFIFIFLKGVIYLYALFRKTILSLDYFFILLNY